jgi:hypothetical protein
MDEGDVKEVKPNAQLEARTTANEEAGPTAEEEAETATSQASSEEGTESQDRQDSTGRFWNPTENQQWESFSFICRDWPAHWEPTF